MPSFFFFTKFWLFSSKKPENSEAGYLGFLTILKEVDGFSRNIILQTYRQYNELMLFERKSWLFAEIIDTELSNFAYAPLNKVLTV